MTSKKRFHKSLGYEIEDRLPMDIIWPRFETIAALKKHFKTDSKEEVFCKLGIDFRWIDIPCKFPEYEKKVNGVWEGDAPGSRTPYIFHDRQTFENEWGIVQRVGDDGKYIEWKDGPLVGKESLLDWELPDVIFPSLNEIKNILKPYNDLVTVIEIEFPFKLAWHLAGYEHLSMMMITNPHFIHELYDRLYEYQNRKAMLAAKAGYDVIAFVGDVAGQLGMMFSPKMFELFDVPRFTKMIKNVKKINSDIKVLYHSDGNIDDIIPMLINCGIDILNPIQSACMEPAAVKRQYGDKLTFHGTISVQDTIPNGSVQDVKKEVIERIKTVGYNGGFIVSPENSIPYDAPLENILAVYNTVREFNYDQLKF